MADIAPFRGIIFDPDAIGEVGHVVAPPYDVISDAGREILEEQSPYNVVRLILGRDEPGDDDRSNKYMRARALLEAWRAAGVLHEQDREALYVYQERFTFEGVARIQRGVFAAVALDGDGVLPHERTYDNIVTDRLDLLRATETNLDPVFGVYDTDDDSAARAIDALTDTPPLLTCTTPDGIEHSLWAMTDATAIDAIVETIGKATVVIADGHHRWRTAGHFRDERRAERGPGPWDRAIMFLADAGRHGPALLPIHRTVSGQTVEQILEALAPIASIEQVVGAPEDLAVRETAPRTFILLGPTGAWRVALTDDAAVERVMPTDRSAAWRALDVAIIHEVIFRDRLGGVTPGFVHSPTEAAEALATGAADAAFLLPVMPFEAVRLVAELGESMPQKSTFFVPKPITGMVMRSIA